jgi:hypothetical protein
LLFHWLDSPRGLHPCACASDFWTCPRTPPLTQFAQKGCQSTGFELRIPMMYIKFCRSDVVNFWRGIQKTLDHRPPTPPSDLTHIYTNQKLLTSGFRYLFFTRLVHDVQNLHFLAPPDYVYVFSVKVASCSFTHECKCVRLFPGGPSNTHFFFLRNSTCDYSYL